MQLARRRRELTMLLAKIDETGGAFDDEMLAELEELIQDTQSVCAELFNNDLIMSQAKAAEEIIAKWRKRVETVDAILRAHLSRVMPDLPLERTKVLKKKDGTRSGGNPQTGDAEGLCTVTWQPGRESVQIADGMTIDDVDDLYVEPEVTIEKKINKAMALKDLQAGKEIRGLVLKKEPFVRLLKSDEGKKREMEYVVAGLVGLLGGPNGQTAGAPGGGDPSPAPSRKRGAKKTNQADATEGG